MFETLIPILLKYVIIPEVAKVVRGNPTITDAEILAKLPLDLQTLVSGNQSFLNSLRPQVAAGGN